MDEQVLLRSDSLDGMRETGGFGQPLHTLYPQIRAVLASELEPVAAWLLAEPVVDRAGSRVDWYTQGDPDHPPQVLSTLPEAERTVLRARLDELLGRGRALAARYAASDNTHRVQLGAMLQAVLVQPLDEDVFLFEDRLTLVRWGFITDRPWEAPAQAARPVPTPVALPPGDITVPDLAMPALPTAAPLSSGPAIEQAPPLPEAAPVAESPALPEQAPPLPEAAPVAESPALPEQAPVRQESPLPEQAPLVPAASSTAPAADFTAEEPARKPPLAQNVPPLAAVAAPVETPAPASLLRYVVVGSGYFWTVFVLALLVLAAAGAWSLWQPGYSPLRAWLSMPPITNTDASAEVARLQARLTQLQAQLIDRQRQCPLPSATTSSASGAQISYADRGTAPGTRDIRPAERLFPGASSSAVGVGSAPKPAADAAPSAPAAKPAAGIAPSDLATQPAAGAAAPSMPVPGSERPATLEDALQGRAPSPAAKPAAGIAPSDLATQPAAGAAPFVPAAKPQPETPPPVMVEATKAEKQEFTERLAAAGAASGEITAALLWNGSADLDLVVTCPSGQQLDYQHPAICGGTLDVDANAARDALRDRPVENAYWAAGAALAGDYQVVVRYSPRKDEQAPGAVPFQVRLSQGGQEKVFKGTIQPGKLAPVTTFTVEPSRERAP
ncbi:MAG: hypothetical protein EKK69_06435 [Candidatus Competibacteraceae bacterium]|nr:MAG: hypothetical protein EKK69_06435 [Candidatus Competibacteraceae bacterium]